MKWRVLLGVGCLSIASLSATWAETANAVPPKSAPTFTLTNVIALAIRNNPSLKQAELSRVSDKLSLMLAKYDFQPQYSLSADYTYTSTRVDWSDTQARTASINSSVSLKNHHGTTFQLGADNDITFDDPANSNPFLKKSQTPTATFTITQELIKGFGKAVVDAALNNAKDTEETNRLNFQQTISNTLSTVITNYFSLIEAKLNYEISKKTLKNLEQTLKHNQLRVKTGSEAPSEALQAESDVASQRVSVENAKNTLDTTRETLLDSIGLKPDTPFKLPQDLKAELKYDETILSGGKEFPELNKTQQLALTNNIDYQTAMIAIRETSRALMTAKDDAKPSLTLTLERDKNGDETGIQNITTQKNFTNKVDLSLSIPIDDLQDKADIVNAKISLQNAIIDLKEKRRQLMSTIQQEMESLKSNKKQLSLQKQAVILKERDVAASTKLHSFGRISTFELTSKQQTLSTEETSLVSSEISYLTSILTLDTKLNLLLNRWNIKVRY